MLRNLPDTVSFSHTAICTSHEQQLNELTNYRFAQTERWRAKRRYEFFSGRWCAAQCLIHQRATEVDVYIAEDRSPIWPTAFAGSISHSSAHAAALVGRKTDFQAIGLDIQAFSEPQLADELKSMILTQNERNQFNNEPDQLTLFDLIFSAKETLFKALYPKCQIFFDHQAAEVIEINKTEGTLRISLLINLGNQWQKNSQFTINFQHFEDSLISWMLLT